MIKLIVTLSKKFKWLDSFIKKLAMVYQAPLSIESGDVKKLASMSKQDLKELCLQDLNRVMTYEKLGEASGLEKPKIYKKR